MESSRRGRVEARGLKVPALTALPFGEHECDGNATDALQACQPPVVVVLEAVVQRVEPALQGFHLWPRHGDHESRLREGSAELDAWRSIKNHVDVGGQRNGRQTHCLDEPPAL
jgi:hypothetical protein